MHCQPDTLLDVESSRFRDLGGFQYFIETTLTVSIIYVYIPESKLGDDEMTTPAIIAAKIAERSRNGLKVTLTDTGWEGFFATAADRDEFVARATAQGRPVKVG